MANEQKSTKSTTAVAGANPAYTTQPKGLEQWFDTTFNKNFPVKLPTGLTKWLADNAWWLALVGAIVSAFSLLVTWQGLNTINTIYSAWDLNEYYAVPRNSAYLWMLEMAVSALLLFMAFQKLKVHQKSGWDLLYYNFLLSLIFAVVGIVLYPSMLVNSLISAAVVLVIGSVVLLQTRHYFNK